MTGGRVDVPVRTFGGCRDYPGLPAGAPNVFVVECPQDYVLVHVSGFSMGEGFTSPEAALAAAAELGTFIDFTRPVLEIREQSRDASTSRRWTDALRRFGGWMGWPASDEALAEYGQP
jgi:hypothetical protein